MKTQVLSLCLASALFAATVNAQTITYPVVANVPFDFQVGNKKLPAGEYLVQTPQSSVVRISTLDKSESVMTLVQAAERGSAASGAKLIFNRYGDDHFLSQIWTAGSNRGVQLQQSRREQEMAARKDASTVAVALVRKR